MGIVRSLFGGAKLPLQPASPPSFAQPDEHDRQALFWWLKRNTSFTANEHNAGLWNAFAAEWEAWMRSMEQPSEHLVTTFKFILDTQLAYERGLKRLRQGDHGVFDRNSAEGWLAKLNTALVERRMEWMASPEVIARQAGVPLAVVQAYYLAHDATMAIASRGPGGYTGSRFGEIRAFLHSIAPPHPLPEPRWEVNFAPGTSAPRDGIYEQVDAQGHLVSGMAYFVKGAQSAKAEWLEFGPEASLEHKSSAFVWRLLWEDTRYEDGTIPDEERRYPSPNDPSILPADEPAIRCEAGHACPESGYWLTPAQVDSRRRFALGETMPAFGGDYGTTIWQWDANQGD